MESFNRVLYFILGLVVVLVFIIVFTGRLNLGKNFKPLAGTTPTPTPKAEEKKGILSFFGFNVKTTPTPTPKAQISTTPRPTQTVSGQAVSQALPTSPTTVKQPQSIPATGSPIEILYFAVPALSAGFYLRKRS